ncbi:L-ascorbate metabolism protein UlaG (beta-lactamase superfamily) [Breoghania corrubedonensis]|uniref:L-ascorbate metabolism protein UlaG (Beta-lactamase superfamily) n=1 Tax=Breoghania corrubedonensis TaxID=665038 RepID=A0A2T5VAB8_9HYPH|nr:MBL fold metallo-hydrolase [Breoghania corrubedonensis]PTW60693.1 L-ascorbate metabolism protein UlaG (beta-lactamase superfamily) [Breoghania corrubedonensis]
MKRIILASCVSAGAALCLFGAGFAQAQSAAEIKTVKVTPLGGQTGEFCRLDRAFVFEDPDGTRLLYDAGMTVAGPDDPRLGDIDALLVSHLHGDHVGPRRTQAVDAGTCAEPDLSVDTRPNTNVAEIAVAKGAKIVTGSEMPAFFAAKLRALGGNPENSVLARFGGSVKVGGVTIATVPAVHSNGVSPDLIGGELGEAMKAAGISGYAGPPTGYILRFSNGLVAYLSGDTGMTAEQESVVRGFYDAKLVVINIGDTYTTGPKEAAWVVNELVHPAAVIPSHANEAATQNGEVVKGTKTEAFLMAVKVPAHVPLSGKTMEFDAGGSCVAGC